VNEKVAAVFVALVAASASMDEREEGNELFVTHTDAVQSSNAHEEPVVASTVAFKQRLARNLRRAQRACGRLCKPFALKGILRSSGAWT
jgi:hypothetical protein